MDEMRQRTGRLAAVLGLLGLALLSGCGTERATEGPQIQQRARMPWQAAIGEVTTNFSDLHCSGVLVARDVMATASHCLFLETAKRPASPEDLIFRPNLGGLQVLPPSRGVAYIAKGATLPLGHLRNEDVSKDWVLVRISPPITAVQPIAVAGLSIEGMLDLIRSGNRLVTAGYGNGAYDALKVNPRCKLLSQKELGLFPDDSWLQLDCVFRSGDSGGAIVLLDGSNQPALIGLMTGYGHLKTVPLGLGVNASQFMRYLHPAISDAAPSPPPQLAGLPLN
jgi:hypothetical protein